LTINADYERQYGKKEFNMSILWTLNTVTVFISQSDTPFAASLQQCNRPLFRRSEFRKSWNTIFVAKFARV